MLYTRLKPDSTHLDLLVCKSSTLNPIFIANSVANSPTSSVCVVCSMTLLATEIADFTRLRHPTDPTSCVSLRKEI